MEIEVWRELPDIVGIVIFRKYIQKQKKQVIQTKDTGTIKIVAKKPEMGNYDTFCYSDLSDDNVKLSPRGQLGKTDWTSLVKSKV